jgi:hypothetical protein
MTEDFFYEIKILLSITPKPLSNRNNLEDMLYSDKQLKTELCRVVSEWRKVLLDKMLPGKVGETYCLVDSIAVSGPKS